MNSVIHIGLYFTRKNGIKTIQGTQHTSIGNLQSQWIGKIKSIYKTLFRKIIINTESQCVLIISIISVEY